MRVLADSHALVWYGHDSPKLSQRARAALGDAIATDGLVISVVSLVELWYVTQTTHGVSIEELAVLRRHVTNAPTMHIHPIDEPVADAFTKIDRAAIRDPWDRFIIARCSAFRSLPVTTSSTNRAWSTRSGNTRPSRCARRSAPHAVSDTPLRAPASAAMPTRRVHGLATRQRWNASCSVSPAAPA